MEILLSIPRTLAIWLKHVWTSNGELWHENDYRDTPYSFIFFIYYLRVQLISNIEWFLLSPFWCGQFFRPSPVMLLAQPIVFSGLAMLCFCSIYWHVPASLRFLWMLKTINLIYHYCHLRRSLGMVAVLQFKHKVQWIILLDLHLFMATKM